MCMFVSFFDRSNSVGIAQLDFILGIFFQGGTELISFLDSMFLFRYLDRYGNHLKKETGSEK